MKKAELVVKFKVLFYQFTVDVNDHFLNNVDTFSVKSCNKIEKWKSNEAEPIQPHYLHPTLTWMHTLTHSRKHSHEKKIGECVYLYSSSGYHSGEREVRVQLNPAMM